MVKVNNLKYFLFLGMLSSLSLFSQENYVEMLKLGIEKSDIELVVKALYHFKLNGKNKDRFLVLANEKVEFRKNMLKIFLEKHCEEIVKKENKDNLILFFAMSIMIASGYTGFTKGFLVGFFGKLILLMISGVKDNPEFKEMYQNSIEIRDLIMKA